ncbi:MAG: hypothetical protein ACI9JL_001830 [Paracoccaceae bacterium]|jgi:hypothetical protein
MRAGFGRGCDVFPSRYRLNAVAILPRIEIGAQCSLFGGRRFVTDGLTT